MHRSRIFLVSACAAVAGLALAGCTSAPSTPTATTQAPSTTAATSAAPTPGTEVSASPAAFLQQAADSTKASGTAKFTGQVDTAGTAGGPAIKVGMGGQIDFTSGAMQADVTTAMLGSQAIKVIVVDGQSYFQMPMFGTKWLKSPADAMGVKVTDPTDGLNSIKDLADLQEVGTEEIDGVSTTHWAGTLNVKDALAQADLGADERAKIEKTLGRNDKGATVDVWVDDSGRIVQMKTTMSLDIDKAQPVAFTSTIKFSDFGSPVDIQAPNPNDVISGSDLGKNLENLAPQGE